ncbi:HIRAN domain-containing protein [Sphingomonas sp. TREG-RG-20F-R18-01]|uniref:HIRAN domain-containing protein n=1 Tax=Sphingomonas sp. TREG-RG-20F-R18-01 TaxID=2914982 RepID=UPI001F573C06|nr:HIRAN domain-containing protein [Sphingomonas sp. TREG-RG-20F-R18-01]
MPISALSLAVVGVRFPNSDKSNRRFEIMICPPGELVELRPEPKNKDDPNAIAVFSARNVQIGYLTAERAPWIGGMLSQGRELHAVFQSASEFGAVIRIAFDGAKPELPDVEAVMPTSYRQPRSADAEDGFYPDYIPPDD